MQFWIKQPSLTTSYFQKLAKELLPRWSGLSPTTSSQILSNRYLHRYYSLRGRSNSELSRGKECIPVDRRDIGLALDSFQLGRECRLTQKDSSCKPLSRADRFSHWWDIVQNGIDCTADLNCKSYSFRGKHRKYVDYWHKILKSTHHK